MGWIAIIFASAAMVCLAIPGVGMFLAMGLAILATALGFVGYRRSSSNPWLRLAGAGGATLGVVTMLLSAVNYGVTLAALSRLEGMF